MRRSQGFTGTFLALVLLLLTAASWAEMPKINIQDTVIKVQLEEDVSMDDAVDSMKLRANNLNFKLVAHQPLYQELRAMGEESKRIEIFQFCDARIAKAMIAYDKHFAAYLPCRIVLLEDEDGTAWLLTMNLGILIQSANLSPELLEKAHMVRDTIASIMDAGASGDL